MKNDNRYDHQWTEVSKKPLELPTSIERARVTEGLDDNIAAAYFEQTDRCPCGAIRYTTTNEEGKSIFVVFSPTPKDKIPICLLNDDSID